MYNEFRLDMLRELMAAGLEEKALEQVMHTLDWVGTKYEVNRRSTDLVPLEDTLPRILMEYLACKSLQGLSKQTLTNYRLALIRFLLTVNKPLPEMQSSDVRLYLYQYQQKRGISNRSLDSLRGKLCSFFQWAVAEGKIGSDPMQAIPPIKYTKTPRTALSQLELEYIRKQCYALREKAVVELLYSTGCRVSELCGMKRGDVDWNRKTIQVFGKGGKYRTTYLNAKAIVSLQDYLASREDDDEHLIVSERQPHQGLTRFAVEHIVRNISNRAYRATGKRVTPHIFRHTTATQAMASGMPVQNISRMLGHAQVETTMIYAEVRPDDVQRDHERFVV